MNNKNLFLFFRSHFRKNLDNVFLQHERGEMSFSELDNNSAKMAAVLRSISIKKGDRVVVQVEKSPEAVLLYLACLRIGAIFVPLNTAYTFKEVEYFLSDAQPMLFVCDTSDEEFLKEACYKHNVSTLLTLDNNGEGSLIEALGTKPSDQSIELMADDDVAAMLYTSGTTGRSKGAMITTKNLTSNVTVLHKYWSFESDDVILHCLPIFHAHGLFVALHCALMNGSKILFHTHFNADKVLADLPNATVMMGVPTFYVRLLDNDNFNKLLVSSIRLFIAGSAPLLAETFLEFEKRTGHKVLERYGMTEALMITSNPYDGKRVAGSVGFALPGVSSRVVDIDGKELPRGEVGVLEIKGPNVFSGYWKMPKKTAEEFRSDGFFITGDLAKMDDENRISIVGREKDLIISGGYNVYPKEIESCIDDISQVKESAVFGVNHADFGEGVTAVIVLNQSEKLDEHLLRNHLNENLAKFKQPKGIFFVSELPRNTMGKVQKNVLREQYANTYSSKVS